MKKQLLAVLIIAAVLVSVLWVLRDRFQNRLTVESRSGQRLAVLEVTITRETAVFRDVPVGAEVTATFRIGSDDHFVVNGQLADGTAMTGEFGYVTNGMAGEQARFV